MMGTRTPNLSQAVHDLGDGRGRLFGIHGDAHQFRAGARQRHHLVDRAGHIGRVGVGHGLDDNRMIAAHLDTCHVHHCRRAAGLHCHRSSWEILILALWLWRPPRPVVYSEVVTAVEVYELTTEGGATDFARVIAPARPSDPTA